MRYFQTNNGDANLETGKSLLDCRSNVTSHFPQGMVMSLIQVVNRVHLHLGDHQSMPGHQWKYIQKRQYQIIFQDLVRRDFTFHNAHEQTLHADLD